MKKLVTAMAACALAGAVFAQVQSVNIVGYSSVALSAGRFFMYGMNFNAVGGTNTISDLIPTVGFSENDQLQIPNVNPTTGIIEFDLYTYYPYDPNFGDGPIGWYDGGFAYAGDVNLPNGTGFWLYTANAQNILIAGEVLSTGVTYTTPASRFTMLANKYPVALNPNTDMVFDANLAEGDQIQVANVNPTTGIIEFDLYTYYPYDPNFGDGPIGWYDGGFVYVNTAIIGVGKGFWLYSANGASFTISRPY